MFSLINTTEVLNRSERVSLTMNRLMDTQKTNIATMVKYYETNLTRIDQTNPFLRVLYSMDVENSLTALDAYNKVKREEFPLAALQGFTTTANKGKAHYDVFWGDVPIIINAASFSQPSQLLGGSSWKAIKPFKVHVVPSLSYSVTRPDLAKHKSGYGVVTVDLPALAFMFHNWHIANQALPLENRERRENFLARYVFPSMMWSQFDCTILQSLNDFIIDPDVTNLQDIPILLSDKTTRLLGSVQDLVMDYNGGATFEQLLKDIPSSYKEDMLTSIGEVKIDVTSQNRFAELAASLPMVNGLFKNTMNNPEMDEMSVAYKRAARVYRQESTVRKVRDDRLRDLLLALESDVDFNSY